MATPPAVDWPSLLIVPTDPAFESDGRFHGGDRWVVSVEISEVPGGMVSAAAGLRLSDAVRRRFAALAGGPELRSPLEFRSARISMAPGGTAWLDLAITFLPGHGAVDDEMTSAFRTAVEQALDDVAGGKATPFESGLLTRRFRGV